MDSTSEHNENLSKIGPHNILHLDAAALGTGEVVAGAVPNVGASTPAVAAAALALAPTHRPPAHVLQLAELAAQHTLSQWVVRYLRAEVYGVKSPNTLDAKMRDLNGFVAWFVRENGHGDITQWMPRDTGIYLSNLEGQGKQPTTINRVFATLRRFAKWAHDEPGNVFALGGLPTRGIKARACDEADCKKISRKDFMRLLKAADALVHLNEASEATERRGRKNARPRRDRAMLAMMYFTGLRVSEQVRLTHAQLQGSHLVNVARKGAGRTRKVFLPADCRQVLSDYLDHERALDAPSAAPAPLFVSTTGDERNPTCFLRRERVNRIFLKIAAQANAMRPDLPPIKLHPHMLRHGFAFEHREKSGSDGETAAALGHTSIQYVARYTRKTDDERDAMVEELFAGG